MKMCICLIIMLTLHFDAALAKTAVRYFNGSAIKVELALGRITEIVLPEKVAKIIKGGESQGLLVEVLNNSVFILPKNDRLADIFIVTVNGVNIPLHFSLDDMFNERLEIEYLFGDAKGRHHLKNSALALMKIMLQGKVPPGADIAGSNKELLIDGQNIKLTLNTVYDLGKMQGLIFKATNMTSNRVVIPIEQLKYPGLMVIASDLDTLSKKGEPDHTSTVYMVIRNHESQ